MPEAEELVVSRALRHPLQYSERVLVTQVGMFGGFVTPDRNFFAYSLQGEGGVKVPAKTLLTCLDLPRSPNISSRGEERNGV